MKLLKAAAAWVLYLLLPYLTAYGLCCLVLLCDNFDLVWLLVVVGFLTPVLYTVSGYFAPSAIRSAPLRRFIPIFAAATILPTALIIWGEATGRSLIWTLDMPHRMIYLAWFSPLLSNTTGAFIHNVVEPVCTGLTHVLAMSGSALGLFLRHQSTRKE